MCNMGRAFHCDFDPQYWVRTIRGKKKKDKYSDASCLHGFRENEKPTYCLGVVHHFIVAEKDFWVNDSQWKRAVGAPPLPSTTSPFPCLLVPFQASNCLVLISLFDFQGRQGSAAEAARVQSAICTLHADRQTSMDIGGICFGRNDIYPHELAHTYI